MYKCLIVVVATAVTASSAPAVVDTNVRAWGLQGTGGAQIPIDLPTVAQVSASGSHSMAVLSDGTIRTWGWQPAIPADLGPVLMADTGQLAGCCPLVIALHTSGQVRCFGDDLQGSTIVPSNLGPSVSVAAGGAHCVAVDRRGQVWCWGWNGYGQTNVPTDLPPAVKAAAGEYHSLALFRDGSARTWGGAPAIPTDLNDIIALDGGSSFFSVLLRKSGQVVCVGGPAPPSDLGPAVRVAAGYGHALALQADGTVRSWGNNNVGQASAPLDLLGGIGVTAGNSFQVALECTRNRRILESPELSPFSFSTPRTWVAKGISDPRAGAVIKVTARGQIGTATRFLNVRADGTLLGTIFGANSGAGACTSSPSVALLTISAAQFASMSSDGAVEIRVEPSINATSAGCDTAILGVSLQYEGQIVDCDGNGIDDICQLESAPLLQDCNGNGALDACEPLGNETDCDGNGVFDSCDISRGEPDEDADGRVDSCELNYGDLNLDGTVDGVDLAALLAVWGISNPPYGDLNGDGLIQGADISYLLARWGPVP